jgi:hypothetical protein
MAYDAGRGKVVLHGGFAPGAMSDTWEWNGSAWTNVTPASGPHPKVRDHAMTYDARRGVVVMFGGTDDVAYLAETWEWNGTTWTNKTPATGNPPARWQHAMAYDATRGRVVMFGGDNESYFRDTWEWDGTTWTEVSPTVGPSARSLLGMAYDTELAQIVTFGGDETHGTSALGDTWTYRFANAASVDGCRGHDGDRDGLIDCADPDCFGMCTPQCNPILMTCSPTWPHCGDAVCQPIETTRLCPADCGPPTALCGDFLCDTGETLANCPGDCTP